MSQNKPPKKKVVVTPSQREPVKPTVSRAKAGPQPAGNLPDLLFGRQTYLFMGLGILLIILGFLLMSGGAMPDADTWDPQIIYGFRRTVLAPVVILAGLGIEIFAIFRK